MSRVYWREPCGARRGQRAQVGIFYEHMLRPALYRLDPERSHQATLAFLRAVQRLPLSYQVTRRLYAYADPRLAFTWKGLTFPSPVGLAAGADKNAEAPRMFEAIGLGFVEIGTVTPLAQPGNPKPRVFRLKQEQSLVNRLGFPSKGALKVSSNLARYATRRVPLGINIGKNASTPMERAATDYENCLESLYAHGDYFTVNVSSPNTAGLTSLQSAQSLRDLAARLIAVRSRVSQGRPPKPLLVKLSPDMSEEQLADAVRACVESGMDGIIATNTTTEKSLRPERARAWEGGLSGRLLHQRSLAVVRAVRTHAPKDYFIIGVGGIFGGEDAEAMLNAGADAVQVYTGMVYRGPGIVKEINRHLARVRR